MRRIADKAIEAGRLQMLWRGLTRRAAAWLPALRLSLLLILQPLTAMAQESRASALATIMRSNGQSSWTLVTLPPQAIKEQVLTDHLFENTIPLFSEGDEPSFDYTFLFYNERVNVYRVVFYKSMIDESCGGYEAVATFYHYRKSELGLERAVDYGEAGFQTHTSCVE